MTLRGRDGFALPLTVFIIAVITVMLTAGLMRVTADRRIADASGSMANARMVAQSGLQSYLGTRTKRPEFDTANWVASKDGDSIRVNVSGGYALVVARIVQRPADTSANETYIVQSTGYYVVPALGSDPQARRSVAQFAVWQSASLDSLTGALELLDGVQNNGQPITGTINAKDSCSVMPTKTGVRAPLNGGPDVAGVTGAPAVNASGTGPAMYTETGIQWSATMNSASLSPDYTYATGDALKYNNNYSVHLYNGNASIAKNGFGTGLLIVTGNLTLGNGASNPGPRGWKGVVLVGGSITFGKDSALFVGQVIAGLNQKNNKTDVSNKNSSSWYIRYSSCEVKKALAGVGGMRPISNAWIDNWASW
ncbi:MAG TPA: hypothetical protein VGI83_03665 [Gemmatimonadales bacterium]|jgi:hypothetical protein